jgi:hypothetical protein
MTAVYFPDGFKAPDILPKLLAYVLSPHWCRDHTNMSSAEIARISSLRLVCTRTSRTSTSVSDTWVSLWSTPNEETLTRSSRVSKRLLPRLDTRALEMRPARLTLHAGKRASAYSQSCNHHVQGEPCLLFSHSCIEYGEELAEAIRGRI